MIRIYSGVPGVQIGDRGIEVNARSLKGRFIKYIQLGGHLIEGEVGVDQIARGQQRAQPHVPLIPDILQIIPYGASLLTGGSIDPKQRTGRHTDDSIKGYLFIHPGVQNACGKHSAHGAALQDQARFHPCPASCDFVDFDILPQEKPKWNALYGTQDIDQKAQKLIRREGHFP